MRGCNSYCTHGGVCILDKNHEGQHDSRYCQWTDEEAISKEKADELFLLEARFHGVENIAEFIIDENEILEEIMNRLEE
jgi:hypothetical protein